jgi:drug/metabolite transporter (DMT)-like permease
MNSLSLQNKGKLALLVTTLLWGGTFSLISNALHDSSPLVFISLRFTAAFILFFPFIFRDIPKINRYDLTSGLILGIIYFASFAFQTAGLKTTSATKSAFITGSFVVFTPLLQFLIIKKKPTLGNIIGIFIVFCGLTILSSKGDSFISVLNEIGNGFSIGDVLTLACAFLYSLYIVYLDLISSRISNFRILVFLQIAVSAFGGALCVLAFSKAGIETPYCTLSGRLIVAIIYTSVFATVITTFLQTKYQQLVSPSQAGIIFSFEPVFAAIFAVFIMQTESLTFVSAIGGLFIFSGLIISELLDKRRMNYAEDKG